MGLPWGSKYSWVRTMVGHKLKSPSLCPAPEACVAVEGWPGVSNITGKAVYSVQRHHLFCTNLSSGQLSSLSSQVMGVNGMSPQFHTSFMMSLPVLYVKRWMVLTLPETPEFVYVRP